MYVCMYVCMYACIERVKISRSCVYVRMYKRSRRGWWTCESHNPRTKILAHFGGPTAFEVSRARHGPVLNVLQFTVH